MGKTPEQIGVETRIEEATKEIWRLTNERNEQIKKIKEAVFKEVEKLKKERDGLQKELEGLKAPFGGPIDKKLFKSKNPREESLILLGLPTRIIKVLSFKLGIKNVGELFDFYNERYGELIKTSGIGDKGWKLLGEIMFEDSVFKLRQRKFQKRREAKQ